ncbi:MAG TPA: hypothetical protein VJS92_10585 [Candidatus Polarisedimenticolaceae bacterium]|nr:hypothetical protein [Candidatus Polarisedimenticolaceae bacterium]
MRRQGGGFGFVILLVVLAAVLLLVGRAWRAMGPTALEVQTVRELKPDAPADSGQRPQPPSPAVPAGKLPDLRETRQQTSAHSKQYQDALSQTQ